MSWWLWALAGWLVAMAVGTFASLCLGRVAGLTDEIAGRERG